MLVTLETLGMPNSILGGPRRLTCLNLPRDLVIGRLSPLQLLRDLPVQVSEEVDMP